MVEHAEQLLNEIKQIKAQYVAEVGKGRRVWPRSIKERVARLDEMGISAKSVATESGIPYETIILWRYNRRHKSENSIFHEVTVTRSKNVPAVRTVKSLAAPKSNGGKRISKSATVTAPDFEIPPTSPATGAALKMTTPNGFVIEGLDARTLAWLLAAFPQGVGHAL